MASRADRAINLALRVMGIGEAERDFRRVGQAGKQSFEQVEKSANGADKAVSEYTARLKRAAELAKTAFDSTMRAEFQKNPAAANEFLINPDIQRQAQAARNKAILDRVEAEKQRVAHGLADSTLDFGQLGEGVGAAGSSLTRFTAIGAAAGAGLAALTAFTVQSYDAFIEHQTALDNFAAELAVTGNRSNATADDIRNMARAIEESTNQSEEGALKAAQALATIPGMTKGVMEEALAATAAFADKAGQELPDVLESRTAPILRAIAEKDMKGLIAATEDLDDATANTIVKLTAAGDTAGAQAALFNLLRDAAGDGPNGAATASNRLSDSWEHLKESLGEQVAPAAADGMNLLATAVDAVAKFSDSAYGRYSRLLGLLATPVTVPVAVWKLMTGDKGGQGSGNALSYDDSAGVGDILRRENYGAGSAYAERQRLEKLYGGGSKPSRGGGRDGKSDAEREAERLKREAEQARAAADRVNEANQDVIESYRIRADEATARIGLEGDALKAVERQQEVEAAVRRINNDLIEKEVEARRAAAAAAKTTFDQAAATAAATAMVAQQRDEVRRLAEQYADANEDIAEFNRRQAQAKAILEQTRTPMEQLTEQVDKAIESLRQGNIDAETFERRMMQLAEGIASVNYQLDEGAHAWRGFGSDVGRTLTDLALNGGTALDLLQELIRLPLERLLYQNVEMPIANWIDSMTGNNRQDNVAAARAGLPSAATVLGSQVAFEPAAQGAAISLNSVTTSGQAAAAALSAVAGTGNPIVDLTGEASRASSALGTITPVAGQFGNAMAQAIAMLSGGGGGGGILGIGLSLAGAAGLGAISPAVDAAIAANPSLFASGTDRVPVGSPFYVGDNGRELMEFDGTNLRVHSNQATRRREAAVGGDTVVNIGAINIPQRADPRRTRSTVNRGLQQALAVSSRKGLAQGAGG